MSPHPDVAGPVVDRRVLTLCEAIPPCAPLVIDSPHSGTNYPPDFGAIAPLRALQRAQDSYVDELFAAAPEQGAVFLAANYPRTYIDPNRPLDDLDPDLFDGTWPGPQLRPSEKSRRGSGLIWRLCPPGHVAIYDRKLGVKEIERRIDHYWRPYHLTLRAAIDRCHDDFGYALHINCHSMHSMSSIMGEGPATSRPDVVLGDREGRSCGREVTTFVKAWCEAQGLSVAINDPYKGVELVRAHSNPMAGRHSLQVEINRRLYLDEVSLDRSDGFETTRTMMTRMIRSLADFAREQSSRVRHRRPG